MLGVQFAKLDNSATYRWCCYSVLAHLEVVGNLVSEVVEGLLIESFFGGLVFSIVSFNPVHFIFWEFMSFRFGISLNSFLDFNLWSKSVVVGVNILEGFGGFSSWKIAVVVSVILMVISIDEMAESEVLEDGVGEEEELVFVNFTWGLGVDLCTGLLNPFPLSVGDCMVLGFSKLLKSYLDFIVGKGSVVVGIKFLESLSGHFVINTAFLSCLIDSDCRSGSKKCSNCEFHD